MPKIKSNSIVMNERESKNPKEGEGKLSYRIERLMNQKIQQTKRIKLLTKKIYQHKMINESRNKRNSNNLHQLIIIRNPNVNRNKSINEIQVNNKIVLLNEQERINSFIQFLEYTKNYTSSLKQQQYKEDVLDCDNTDTIDSSDQTEEMSFTEEEKNVVDFKYRELQMIRNIHPSMSDHEYCAYYEYITYQMNNYGFRIADWKEINSLYPLNLQRVQNEIINIFVKNNNNVGLVQKASKISKIIYLINNEQKFR